MHPTAVKAADDLGCFSLLAFYRSRLLAFGAVRTKGRHAGGYGDDVTDVT